jgi:hypothetical protein
MNLITIVIPSGQIIHVSKQCSISTVYWLSQEQNLYFYAEYEGVFSGLSR